MQCVVDSPALWQLVGGQVVYELEVILINLEHKFGL